MRLLHITAAALALSLGVCASAQAQPGYMTRPAAMTRSTTPYLAEGLVRVQSRFGFDETIARIRADVAAKGIREFAVVPQSALAQGAQIDLRPSTLIIFGNPPLGTQFITANPNAGLDWPVRVLVYQDADGRIWAVYHDFHYLERRHHIANRQQAFNMADMVINSILDSVRAPSA
ncbi:MAG TPA: DUF302 domain-containing protein [Caulobacterales bacterium]|nr:DUF302 domain-containing protein [Caulobacterales bacterium]